MSNITNQTSQTNKLANLTNIQSSNKLSKISIATLLAIGIGFANTATAKDVVIELESKRYPDKCLTASIFDNNILHIKCLDYQNQQWKVNMIKGDLKGDTGATGAQGIQGEKGDPGRDGVDGDSFFNQIGNNATLDSDTNLTTSGNSFVQVGNSSATCDTNSAGAIRYNTTDNALEFCNGSDWRSISHKPACPPDFSWDVDGNGTISASNDGIIIITYLLDPNNISTTNVGAGACRNTNAELKAYLDAAGNILDADGDGVLIYDNDGEIIAKYLLNSNDNTLHEDISDAATRRTSAELKAYLDLYR